MIPLGPFAMLLYTALSLVLTRKSYTVALPICYEHRHHWLWRKSVLSLVVIFSLIFIIAGIALGAPLDPDQWLHSLGGIVLAVGFTLFIAAFIVAFILQKGMIYPQLIERDKIHFVGVHRNFVRTLAKDRKTRPK